MIIPFGHSCLIFIAAFLDRLPAPHQDPIPDRLFARDPVTAGEHPGRKTVIVNPAPDGALVPTHEAGNGPKADQPFTVGVCGRDGHNGIILPYMPSGAGTVIWGYSRRNPGKRVQIRETNTSLKNSPQ